jgi:hypothetical protein
MLVEAMIQPLAVGRAVARRAARDGNVVHESRAEIEIRQ